MTPLLDILSSGQELGSMTVPAILGVAVVALAVVNVWQYRENIRLSDVVREDAKAVTVMVTEMTAAVREVKEHIIDRDARMREEVRAGVQRVIDHLTK